MKILIIQQKMIGDVLVSSMLFEILKNEYPNSELHYVINSHTFPVVEHNPFIDKFVFFKPNFRKNKLDFFKFLWSLRKEKYDIVIDAYSKLESNLITLFTAAKKRISYHKYYTKFIYTSSLIPIENPRTNLGLAIEKRLQLIEAIGIHNYYDIVPKLYLNNNDKQIAEHLLSGHNIDHTKKLVMVSIIGSSEDKTYPLQFMAEVVDYIAETIDCNLLFNYVPNQIEDAKKMFDLCKPITQKKVHFDIIANNLKSFISLIKKCDFIIGNDGGAINMAKALNKPSFIIFSPWIKKKAWATFEDGMYHESVHLHDYAPELFENLSKTKVKEDSLKLYQHLRPKLFKDKLVNYLKRIDSLELLNYNITNSIQKLPSEPLTALVITHNEEENISSLIKNLSFADHIIIVDSFSNDNTEHEVKKHNNVTFIQNAFKNFSDQRNFALQHVNTDWVLFVDADERVTPNLKKEILEVINDSQNDTIAYEMYRQFYFKNKKLNYSGWQTDKVFRLYKKNHVSYKEDLFVHELLDINGKQGLLKHKLEHYSYNSYSSYKHKMLQYAKLRAKELAVRKLKPNSFHFYIKPTYRFLNHYILRLGILDGKKGLTICYLGAYYVHQRYVELLKIYSKHQ